MDTYFSQSYAVSRLLTEYKKHGQLIIALDFDDTIYDCHKKGHEFNKVIELIKECNQLNFRVVIFTASKPTRYDLMRKYCDEIGIKFEGINTNVSGLPDGLGTSGKIYYNILLDDRAGLFSAYTALREAVDMIKQEK